jgi:hypothetical protein
MVMKQRIKQILKRFFLIPEIRFPKVRLGLPRIPFPHIPFHGIGVVLGAINTTILVLAGVIGIAVSFINQYQIGNVIHWMSPVLPFRWENILGTNAWVNITDQFVFDTILAAQANFVWTISGSIGLIVLGFMLHVTNFGAWWRGFKAAPMAVVRSPIRAYRRIVVWRNWLLAKVEYLNSESQKWKLAFNIAKSPFSLLRALGFSPQMAIGLLAVGSTAGAGVIVNETILAERSFSNGDSGIYSAPAQHPDATLEQTMAWRQENSGLGKEDNTLRIVLGTIPVREIRIENVSVGTVYNGSAIPSSAHHSAGGTAAAATAVLIGGNLVSGGTDTYLEIGQLVVENSRCSQMYFDNILAHTINIIGIAADGISISQTAGTSRMRAVGGGHHQAEAMLTSGGSYDRIHIDSPTTAVNGKIEKLILSNIFSEGGACVFDRIKVGTMTIQLNEVGGGGTNGASDGFATKDFKINQSVTASNWNVIDNVEVLIGAPTATLTNE